MDPDQPIYAVQTMREAMASSMAPKSLATVALALFAAFAVFLAAVGFYLVVAFAIHGFLQGLLFQISGTDPATFGTVTVVLLGVAFFASYLPARRASRLDPVEALREE